jgi:hypothetical protein
VSNPDTLSVRNSCPEAQVRIRTASVACFMLPGSFVVFVSCFTTANVQNRHSTTAPSDLAERFHKLSPYTCTGINSRLTIQIYHTSSLKHCNHFSGFPRFVSKGLGLGFDPIPFLPPQCMPCPYLLALACLVHVLLVVHSLKLLVPLYQFTLCHRTSPSV